MMTIHKTLQFGLLLAAAALTPTALAQCAGGNENGFVPASTPSEDFREQADGTVLHTPSRRVWQRCALGQSWDGTTCTGTATRLSWSAALAAAEAHEQAGFDDWRVPNRNELAAILEDRCFGPALNAVAFPVAPVDGYWTSSPVTDGLEQAWRIDFVDGLIEPASTGTQQVVRLVRGGPW
ncbi:DUF1566 domain-containing protein [Wenzhouxiangella sp. XN79A]|uniref:Lcl C-terminal domain-containing protein n=2 Tax=Wenzhouxiangella sp. XN79A TaxID=2724193 RepID=UPI00144AE133|nr:DUF1566 domain-containing protein [Wenzhouxiangella sp. XN79A]NKI36555.1 DUF1566 domain-containing protein [Wenzhouxiangella sp. XN79A]